MSDGNFNRALLPATPYRSGLKMGKQIAFKQAEEAFQRVVSTHLPNLTPEEAAQLEAAFRKELRQE